MDVKIKVFLPDGVLAFSLLDCSLKLLFSVVDRAKERAGVGASQSSFYDLYNKSALEIRLW